MTKTTTELEEFHAFVGECLKSEYAGPSPEDAVNLWRTKHPNEDAALEFGVLSPPDSVDKAELVAFHIFIGECLRSEHATCWPEEVADLWRIQHPSEAETAAVRAALREAIADMEAGEVGMTLEEFERKFRKEHGLPDVLATDETSV